jgi:hypothetical protein
MLEIRLLAPCARVLAVAYRWHSTGVPNSRRPCANWGGRHSWLCSVQRAAAVRDRVTAPGSPSFRTTGSRQSRAHLASHLKSHPCKISAPSAVESYPCKKTGGPPLSSGIMLRSVVIAAKACTMSTYTEFGANSHRICTCGFVGLKPPLESTLTIKKGGARVNRNSGATISALRSRIGRR